MAADLLLGRHRGRIWPGGRRRASPARPAGLGPASRHRPEIIFVERFAAQAGCERGPARQLHARGTGGCAEAVLPTTLTPLLGVAPFPGRHGCAILPWQALREALTAKR